MKKLALVLTFVFGVAMIAPAFAVDQPKTTGKAEVKKECASGTKSGCSSECAKACEKAGKTCATAPAKDAKPAVKK